MNTIDKRRTKLEQVIDDLAQDPDMKQLVLNIEARPETTQHHYGDYGAALCALSNGSKITAWVLAQVFKRLGANPVGVDNGFKLFV
jgi:hypothetical protein